jgi:hypothetical protein
MKTMLYSTAILLLVSASACKKETSYTCKITCDECVKTGYANTICAADFGDKQAYEAAVDAYEAQGFNCTRSTSDTKTVNSDTERNTLEDGNYICVEK